MLTPSTPTSVQDNCGDSLETPEIEWEDVTGCTWNKGLSWLIFDGVVFPLCASIQGADFLVARKKLRKCYLEEVTRKIRDFLFFALLPLLQAPNLS